LKPAPFHPSPPFLPSWWLPGGHLQTLGGKYLRRAPELFLQRERWDTPDGDFLDLDFGPDPDPERPLVLILHGLEGFSRRPYVLYAMDVLAKAGMASVALNFRGCSGEPNRLPRLYHSGETEDPRFVLEGLRSRWPGRPLGGVGFSLGGNVLLKLLGEEDDGGVALLEAAAVISVPYDLSAGVKYLEGTRLGQYYTNYFLKSLKKKILDKEELLAPLLDLPAVLETDTLQAFDDKATGPLHGFSGAEEYYARSSSNQFLPNIQLPTLLIQSQNDPFLPKRAIPHGVFQANPFLNALVTRGGGHVGFVAGGIPGRPHFWAEEQVRSFLLEAFGLKEMEG
jgi:predicted alpha/beta-fold hydrolase